MDLEFGLELTQDPFVIIVHRKKDLVIYFDINSMESWIIYGHCTGKGTCGDGLVYELDCPVRPDLDCSCDLRGVYL